MIFAYDCFDTIVHRDCNPEVILYRWAKRCTVEFRLSTSPSSLYKIRKNKEQEAKNNGVSELSYYELLRRTFLQIGISDIKLKKTILKASKIEIEEELKHIYRDSIIVKEIEDHYSNNEKIIVISDFYADKNYIKKILDKVGVFQFISEIYVSSEYNRRKSSGELYRKVLELQNIQPSGLTMTGDNRKSDYEIPLALGINTVYREFQNQNLAISDLKLKQEYNKLVFDDYRHKKLNPYCGEICFFISSLYKRLVKEGVKKAYFCSREGQTIKKLFDKYLVVNGYENTIETVYLYVSRRATLLPSLKLLEDESFSMFFRQYRSLTICDFLKNLSFSESQISNILDELQVSDQEVITEENNILRQSKYFAQLYEEKREKQRSCFLKYLNSLGVNLNGDVITIVDIGWKGTIQDCINEATPDTVKVRGYYLGLRTKEFEINSLENKSGVLFSDYPQKSLNYDLLEYGYMFYERIFMADHGPVRGYEEINGKCIPDIDSSEKELRLYNLLRDYQNEMLINCERIFSLFSKTRWDIYERYDLMIDASVRRQCLVFPKNWEIEKVARETVVENFGDLSRREKKDTKKRNKLRREKGRLFYVDYTYRILDKFHLKILYPLASVYCLIVYGVKKMQIEKVER